VVVVRLAVAASTVAGAVVVAELSSVAA